MLNQTKLIARIEEHLKKDLTANRFAHVLSVRDQARNLAKRYNMDSKKVEIAALLHDSLKEFSDCELLKFAKKHDFLIDEYEQDNISLIHGKLAPFFAKNQFGIDDEIVNSAMRKHTTGASKMGPVDKVLFVADFCEPLRQYSEAETVRNLAERDLEAASFEVIKHKIRKNLSKNRMIHPESFNAYNTMAQSFH